MNDRSMLANLTVSIAAVERDTGLSKDTLRVWERRYGFPVPERDALGERAYPLPQVERLRLIKRLLDAGHRPGRVVALPTEQLEQLATALPGIAVSSAPNGPDLRAYIGLLKSHDPQALHRALAQAQWRMGLQAWVVQVLAPLNTLVGEAWLRGEIDVFEEHVYTETLQTLLRHALADMPRAQAQDRPRVLLGTFAHEPHGLGLLMAQALLSLEGCYCVSLGPQTPLADIAMAAAAYKVDVVALSFTATLSLNYVLGGLAELRSNLGPQRAIWAGGQCPAIHRRQIEGVLVLESLEQLPQAVAQWRESGSPIN
jgi:MerR family transcriptional regulator, light-induced transcriptional regulator